MAPQKLPVSLVQQIKELSAVDLEEADPDPDALSILSAADDGEDIVGSQEVQPWHVPRSDHRVGLPRSRLTVGKTCGTASVKGNKSNVHVVFYI